MQANFDKMTMVGACLRLPVPIDKVQLRSEVESLPAAAWGHNRARVHRETRSLFLKGHPPLLEIPDDEDQPLLAQCPGIRSLIYDRLPGHPGKCLLAALRPGGIIYPHRDAANAYFLSSVRIHVPIVTNEHVFFYCADGFYRLSAGEVWAVNNLAPHAVVNDSESEQRIHLIVDIFPNREMLDLLGRGERGVPTRDDSLMQRLATAVPAD